MRMIVFSASWCPNCKVLKRQRTVEQFQAVNRKVEIVNHDVQDEDRVADHYRIRSIPTIVFEAADGGELARINGAPTFGALSNSYAKAMRAGTPEDVEIGAYADVVRHFTKAT